MLAKKLKIFLFSALALTLVTVVVFTAALFTSFDVGNAYFSDGPLVTVFEILSVAAIAWFTAAFIILPKNKLDGGTPLSMPVAFPSGLMALVCLSVSVLTFMQLGGRLGGFDGLTSASPLMLGGCGIFMIAAAGYFVLNIALPYGSSRDLHALLGFSVPISSVLLVAVCYFDITLSMNSPAKLVFQMTVIVFMLFMLTELKAMISKAMPRTYLVIGLVTIFVSALSSLPWLIYAAAGNAPGLLYPTYYIYNIFSLGICAYVTTRMIVYVSAESLLERIAPQTPDENE